jgi:acyl carrier protein
MMPSSFIRLDALPLTPSGKVDRRALPTGDGVLPELSSTYAPPATPIEQKLANIWSELLGIERVGIHDNFFELGGHSLLMIQVLGRIRGKFHTNVSIRRFFETPTVAGLAEAVEEKLTDEIADMSESEARTLLRLAK